MKKFIPKTFQILGIELFLRLSFAGLFWPPGLGKTAVALHAFEILKKKGLVDRMMVISKPKVIVNTWPREIQKWMPYMSHAIIKGGARKRLEGLESGADILLMNMENTQRFVDLVAGKRTKVKRRWKLLPPDRPDLLPKNCMLVIDESSKFRNSNSGRFKSLTRKIYGKKGKCMLNMFKRRYILTGSPAPRSLMNLWAQMFIIDLGDALGEYITSFRITHFHPAGFKGYSWEINPGAAKLIYKRLTKRILRIGEGAIKMPKKVFVNRFIDVDEETRVTYAQMERESVLELEGEEITAVNAGVKTQKLRQLANGFVYGKTEERKRTSYQIHLDKALEALNLVEETQGVPAIIGYIFDSDLVALEEVFQKHKGRIEVVSRRTKDDSFNKIERDWNAGKIDVLLAQIDIVSHGLNLQETEASVIYYTIPWDLEAYEQFYRRVWRQGQKFTVMIYHLLTRDTVDDKVVLPCIQKKDKRQQHFLDYLEKFMERKKKFVRPDSITKVGNKEGMGIIAETIKLTGQRVPKVKEDVKDPGGVLLSALNKQTKGWTDEVRLIFCKEVMHDQNYDGPTGLPTVRKMIAEILCADIETPITPETYKMWPGFRPKGSKKMATKKVGKKKAGFGSTKKASAKEAKISKAASKKAASKKAASKKKVAKKTPATASVKINPKTIYVKGTNEKVPKVEARQKIVKKVKDAKGRGIKAQALHDYCVKTLKMPEKRAAAHVAGCAKNKFIKTK